MFAMRVASVLGWFNVDAMLETGQPGQLAEWMRYAELEPIGSPWEAMSLGATSMVNEVRGIAAGLGGNKNATFMEWDDLVPGRVQRRKKEQAAATSKAIDDLEEF